jgi:hypothetical protein
VIAGFESSLLVAAKTIWARRMREKNRATMKAKVFIKKELGGAKVHENEGREGKTISAKRGRAWVTARKSRRALTRESASLADIRREMKERRAVLTGETGEELFMALTGLWLRMG